MGRLSHREEKWATIKEQKSDIEIYPDIPTTPSLTTVAKVFGCRIQKEQVIDFKCIFACCIVDF